MRRQTAWVFVAETNSTIAGATTALLIGTANAALLALRPFTIVRTRGFLHVHSDQEAASENYGGSIGYSVVSDQAVAIGITAVPTPTTDRGSDLFFVYESLWSRLVVTPAGTGVGAVFIQYDSKAMRKVEDGQDLAVVIETASIVSSGVFLHGARILIKLN